MSDDQIERPQEIVIVRRRGGEDGGGHHGGAWKIAYADFVTAMMAFFLVMWLINASNEETRAQVASYFNPIKLTDSSTGNRGLKDKKDSKNSQKGEGDNTAGGSPPDASDVKHEAEIMANPDKLLAAIEAKTTAAGQKGSKLEGQTGAEIGSAMTDGSAPVVGDPFDPKSWEAVPPSPPVEPPILELSEVKESEPMNSGNIAHAAPQTGKTGGPQADKSVSPEQQPATSKTTHLKEELKSSIKTPVKPSDTESKSGTVPMKPAAPEPAKTTVQVDEAGAIATELASKLGTGLDDLKAAIEVKKTDEGTLISLTDKQSYGMFRSGSAEPQPELVRLVEAIAAVLTSRGGYIVVRGHTDSIPYRNKKYDNWQLSTARAHLAQYMLVRGGLDERRIRRIEGLADRDPKNPNDPQAPENRRIEILLGHDRS